MDQERRSERYRALARECEERAQKAASPKEAIEWTQVARSWLMVAEEIDAIEGWPKTPKIQRGSRH